MNKLEVKILLLLISLSPSYLLANQDEYTFKGYGDAIIEIDEGNKPIKLVNQKKYLLPYGHKICVKSKTGVVALKDSTGKDHYLSHSYSVPCYKAHSIKVPSFLERISSIFVNPDSERTPGEDSTGGFRGAPPLNYEPIYLKKSDFLEIFDSQWPTGGKKLPIILKISLNDKTVIEKKSYTSRLAYFIIPSTQLDSSNIYKLTIKNNEGRFLMKASLNLVEKWGVTNEKLI